MTRSDSQRSRAGALTALAVAVVGVLGWPGAAWAADVTSTPGQARQGDPVKFEIVVPEERPGARTSKVELRLPTAYPIGEAYPMSVDGWAPQITTRKLDEPVASIHGPLVDTVTAAVTWTRVGSATTGPNRFAVSMGPLPQAERMTFEVVQTYSDKTVVRWADPAGGAHPAPVLALLPAAPGGGADTGGGHGAHPTLSTRLAEPHEYGGSALYEPEEGGWLTADLLLGGGLVAGLGGGAAAGWLGTRWLRRRRDTTGEDDPKSGETQGNDEGTAAGSTAETAPTDTATTPADTKAAPADTATTPADTATTPADTKATPAETKATPAEPVTPADTVTPADAEAAPASPEATPAAPGTAPAGEAAVAR
ncbi:DUF1775 domain-containing protein [Micromonospora yangpuensis]|uniref:Uncharacterized protein YcnI n=1 Tax=Micromonospora yangpuensis TaxID=683228 RepID=A0A1C6UHU2_9ACTN|nr:DUF1775 domain-containing protein [Micromonospora yangpuensis]GGM03804.1 hypothetical protein GCM10012279_21970 [Micromonospora yangpuensis]SCL53541.1 Uncharacterized protein YcnI [Micromonospora yangpuensis]